MSLDQHKGAFIQWARKFVRASLTETLKIPDAVIYGGESPYESLLDAVQFWRDLLNKEKIWTEATCSHIYDEVLQRIIEDIDQLNLTYKIEKGGRRRPQDLQGDQMVVIVAENRGKNVVDDFLDEANPESMVVQYIANNNTD
jgi:hypothetical protein